MIFFNRASLFFFVVFFVAQLQAVDQNDLACKEPLELQQAKGAGAAQEIPLTPQTGLIKLSDTLLQEKGVLICRQIDPQASLQFALMEAHFDDAQPNYKALAVAFNKAVKGGHPRALCLVQRMPASVAKAEKGKGIRRTKLEWFKKLKNTSHGLKSGMYFKPFDRTWNVAYN